MSEKKQESLVVGTPAALAPKGIFDLSAGFKEILEMAKFAAGSNMVPEAYKGKPNDIVVAWQHGAEVGLSPLQSLRSIAVIKERPSLWGDSLLAVAQSNPKFIGIEENTFEDIAKTGVARCTITRAGMKPYTATFSRADAETAQLWGRNVWKSYPWRMMQMRARAFALRNTFADSLSGISMVEEVRDYALAQTYDAPEQLTATVVEAEDPQYSEGLMSAIEAIQGCSTVDELAKLAKVWKKEKSLGAGDREQALSAWSLRREEIENPVDQSSFGFDQETGEVHEAEA